MITRTLIRLPSALAVVGVMALSVPGIAHAQPPANGCVGLVRGERGLMGTRVRIQVCPEALGRTAAEQAIEAGFREIARLEQLWSTWVPTSDVSKIVAAAGGRPVKIAPETVRVLSAALAGSAMTGGLFDITFAPLGRLWRFDHAPGTHVAVRLKALPAPEDVARLKRLVGWRGLEVDTAHATARLRRPKMAIHLGGIGKGAAVDAVVAILRRRGFRGFAVQAGGDLYCGGRNGQRPWRIGIAHPRKRGAIIGALDVSDAAFSTSGDYERFAVIDGKRYHHILDTRTGYPATASQSATVLAKNATLAEILTKAAFIRGGSDGLKLLHDAGAKGVIVTANGTVIHSPGLVLEGTP